MTDFDLCETFSSMAWVFSYCNQWRANPKSNLAFPIPNLQKNLNLKSLFRKSQILTKSFLFANSHSVTSSNKNHQICHHQLLESWGTLLPGDEGWGKSSEWSDKVNSKMFLVGHLWWQIVVGCDRYSHVGNGPTFVTIGFGPKSPNAELNLQKSQIESNRKLLRWKSNP